MSTRSHVPRGVLYVIIAGSLVVSLISKNGIFSFIALALSLVGAFSRKGTDAIEHGWMRFGGLLGKINSTLLLSIAYFCFLTPLACAWRMTVKSRADNQASSFVDRKHAYSSNDFVHTW